MSEKEILKILKKIDKKLDGIDAKLKGKVSKDLGKKLGKQPIEKKSYKGLSGGIELLIKNKYFNKERKVKEVTLELKREGYHYPGNSVAKILARDFVKKKRKLTRINSKNLYKYVIRK